MQGGWGHTAQGITKCRWEQNFRSKNQGKLLCAQITGWTSRAYKVWRGKAQLLQNFSACFLLFRAVTIAETTTVVLETGWGTRVGPALSFQCNSWYRSLFCFEVYIFSLSVCSNGIYWLCSGPERGPSQLTTRENNFINLCLAQATNRSFFLLMQSSLMQVPGLRNFANILCAHSLICSFLTNKDEQHHDKSWMQGCSFYKLF